MSKPTFYELVKDYPRDGIRAGEAKGVIPKGVLDAIIIYEEYLYWRTTERQWKKGEIYQRLADRHGYSTATIRRKIAMMTDKDFPPEAVNDINNFILFLYMKWKQKEEALLAEEEEGERGKVKGER